MKPAERQKMILEDLEIGPATVNHCARYLRMIDQADVVLKDLKALRRLGQIHLFKVRHALLDCAGPRRHVTILVAIKEGETHEHARGRA